jgi:hypothetical protein
MRCVKPIVYAETMPILRMHMHTSSYNNKNSRNFGFDSREHLEAITAAHAVWINRYINDGWDAYFFTVMFNHISGSREKRIIQMHQEMEKMYNRLATRMVRKPRSLQWKGLLPIGLFSPDLPVPKFGLGEGGDLPLNFHPAAFRASTKVTPFGAVSVPA